MRISRIALLLGSAAACLAQSRDAMFDKLADRYYTEAVFRYAPEAGTQAGFHQYDPLLATGARSDIQAEIAALRGFETEVAGFDARGLSAFVAADRELLLSQIRGQLPRTRSDSPVGEESGPLLLRCGGRDLRHHEPQLRAAGRAP